VQNDRLAAIGTLAAGLAHEINNPLTYIQMNLQLIAEGVLDSDPLEAVEVAGLATDAIDGVERVSRIVRDLLALARKAPDAATKQTVRLHVGEVVRAAVTLAGPQSNKVALVEISVPEHLYCMGRESELVQVLLNLIINACHAMEHRPRAENRVMVTACHDDDRVWIEVRDNGPGIPQEIQQRIFEPLFTTKPVGKGTGLGLSVSRSIVEAHDGVLLLHSVEGEGCRFTMKIPRAEQGEGALEVEDPSTVTSPRRHPLRPARSARVLLVDDDPRVARSLGRVLRPLGVVVVDSGHAGLDALEEHAFEVVVSDVRMPEMSGPEFHDLAQTIRTVPFVFVTGGTTREDQLALDRLPWQVLRKPIQGSHLLEVVTSYLADEPPSAPVPIPDEVLDRGA
jgi:CheY-like chemotaxis protein